jgi:hypothetical protein
VVKRIAFARDKRSGRLSAARSKTCGIGWTLPDFQLLKRR